MKKIMLCIAMLMTIGFADVCVDADVIQHSYPIYKNGSLYTTLAVNETCDYGCDQALNKCMTVDTDYGIMVVIAFIFFIIVTFWLSNHFKPKEEEMDYSKIGLSFVFLVLGMILTLGLLLYVGSIGSGYVSGFITNSSNMILSIGNIWGVLIGIFIFFIAIFFINGIFRNYIMSDRRRGSGREE
jgi:hypothetical protein